MATGGGVIPVRMVFSSEAKLQPPVKERTHMKKAACVPVPQGHKRHDQARMCTGVTGQDGAYLGGSCGTLRFRSSLRSPHLGIRRAGMHKCRQRQDAESGLPGAEFLLHKSYEVHGIKRRASPFNTDRINHLYRRGSHEEGDALFFASWRTE